MSLIRVSEKKLAANRANAQKSKGPSTPAGKERSSRNACVHHIYARKFSLHPEWKERIWAVVRPAVATVEDPFQRAPLTRYLFYMQWIEELAAFEARLLNQSIARHKGDYHRGVQHLVTTGSLFLAIETRIHALYRRANRARIAWKHAQRMAAQEQTIPNVIESKPLAMAAPPASPALSPQ